MITVKSVSFPQSITIDTLANTCGGLKVGTVMHYSCGGGKIESLHVDTSARILYVEKDCPWKDGSKFLAITLPGGSSFLTDVMLGQMAQAQPAKR